MIEIRVPRLADTQSCTGLAALAIGPERAAKFIDDHLHRHRLIVAESAGDIVGFLAWRTDWFESSFLSLIYVREDFRRKGIAREFFKSVEVLSPYPRIFSTVQETDIVSMKLHAAMGYAPSGHLDNLPRGERELFFYKRIEPRQRPSGGVMRLQ